MAHSEQNASVSAALPSPSRIPAPPAKLQRPGLRTSLDEEGERTGPSLLPSPVKNIKTAFMADVNVNTSIEAQPRAKAGTKNLSSSLDGAAGLGKSIGSGAQGMWQQTGRVGECLTRSLTAPLSHWCLDLKNGVQVALESLTLGNAPSTHALKTVLAFCGVVSQAQGSVKLDSNVLRTSKVSTRGRMRKKTALIHS